MRLLWVSEAEWDKKLIFQFTKVTSCPHIVTDTLLCKVLGSWSQVVMGEYQLLRVSRFLSFISGVYKCFGAWMCFQFPSALMQLNHLHPRASSVPSHPSSTHSTMALPGQRGDHFSSGSSLPTSFQPLFPSTLLAILKGGCTGAGDVSTANRVQEEKHHCPKYGPACVLRTLINGCWPVRIQSIYLDEQKRSLLMSLMQVALLERARPENQDARVSKPSFLTV